MAKTLPHMPLQPHRNVIPIGVDGRCVSLIEVCCEHVPYCLTTGLYKAPLIIKSQENAFVLLSTPAPNAIIAWSAAGLSTPAFIGDAWSHRLSWGAASNEATIDVICGLQKMSFLQNLHTGMEMTSSPELIVGAASFIPQDEEDSMLDADGRTFITRT